MAVQTKPRTQTPPLPTNKGQVAVIAPPRLPPPEENLMTEYGINREGWRTLTESIFPAAKTVTAVLMALDYCKRRKLDPFKHPVHIVPIWNSQAGDEGKGAMVETIWPGINELRTTAIRTGQYAGMDVPVFGPEQRERFAGKIKKWKNGQAFWEEVTADVEYPEWCQITVYRTLGGNRVPFPGPRVYWLETYARLRNDCEVPNSMWEKRANGQLEKCAEAAALRRAFPEELGSDYSIDEIGAFTTHAPTDVTGEGSATVADPPPEPRRSDFTEPSKTPEQPAKTEASPPGGDGGQQEPPVAGGAPTASSGQPAVTDLDEVPPEHAQPGQLLTFQTYKANENSKFVAFAEDFLPKTNPLGAQQFLAAYGEKLEDMEKSGIKVRMEAAKWIRDTALEIIGTAAMTREPGEEG